MKGIIASLVSAIALLVSNIANSGCIIFMVEEPDSRNVFED